MQTVPTFAIRYCTACLPSLASSTIGTVVRSRPIVIATASLGIRSQRRSAGSMRPTAPFDVSADLHRHPLQRAARLQRHDRRPVAHALLPVRVAAHLQRTAERVMRDRDRCAAPGRAPRPTGPSRNRQESYCSRIASLAAFPIAGSSFGLCFFGQATRPPPAASRRQASRRGPAADPSPSRSRRPRRAASEAGGAQWPRSRAHHAAGAARHGLPARGPAVEDDSRCTTGARAGSACA